MSLQAPEVVAPEVLLLEPGDGVPNNPALPVLHYRGAVAGEGDALARAFETLFSRHRWPAAWRNGIFGFHHFHTTAHETLGIYSGEVRVRLGGEGGVDVDLGVGDVVVLPAGVGHKQLSCRGRLAVVGAYPPGQDPDMCRPDPARLHARLERVATVALPEADPLHGIDGPLMRHWVS